MAKRALLTWEVGAGQGHILQLGWIGQSLRDRGIEPLFAVRNTPAAAGGMEMHPAPLWPGAAKPRPEWARKAPAGHADTLSNLGIERPGVLRAMILEWEQLFSSLKPDLIVADSAPASLAAARGRYPTLAIGNGFNLPPSNVERFPDLEAAGAPQFADQTAMLETVNSELRATGRAALARLSEVYATDRTCVGTFAEFDPYRRHRTAELAAPWLPDWQRTSARREEVFVYCSLKTKFDRTIFTALANAAAGGMRIRLYAPRLKPDWAEWLTANRVRVEPSAVPLAKIEAQARLIVSLGSLGMVAFAAAAGIPQIVIPCSLATRMTGQTVQKLGIGRSFELSDANPLEPSLLRQALREAFYDDELTRRAIGAAPDFLRRTTPRAAETAADLAQELL